MASPQAGHATTQSALIERQRSRPLALLVLSRYEFMPGGVFFIFASAALALLRWSSLSQKLSLIAGGSAVWYLSHLVGSQVNCLADVEIDRSEKTRLSDAVRTFGAQPLVRVIEAEAAVTLALTVYMAADTGRVTLPLLWLLGLIFALAYSLEPLRLKRRGWLNPGSLALVLYVLPMAYGYVTLQQGLHVDAIGALAATGLQMLALIMLNPAEDVETDRASGIETPCVRYGLRAVAPLAAGAFLAGTAASIWCFIRLADGQGMVTFAGLALAFAGQVYVLQELIRLARAARHRPGSQPATRLTKRNPVHFAILGLTLALASGVIVK
jgi:4-hydroxybenzoate polyprenyltransferase